MANVTTLPSDDLSIEPLLTSIRDRFDNEPSFNKKDVINALTAYSDRVLFDDGDE